MKADLPLSLQKLIKLPNELLQNAEHFATAHFLGMWRSNERAPYRC
ncbi:MAG: hypothetical protein ACLUVI_06565 [Acutalibacteraceae bacterium]